MGEASRKATPEEAALLNGITEPAESRRATEGEAALLNETEATQEDWWEDKTMVSRMLLDGATLGFSDEIAASLYSGMVKWAGQGGDSSYTDLYRSAVQGLEGERDAYTAAHPTAAMGLNVVGALATAPLSLSGTVGKTALKATSAILPKAYAGGKVARSTGLATGLATEGAVAGAGFANEGSDVAGAAVEGAKQALLFGTVLNRAGAGIRRASQRNVAQPLGEGDDFIPLNLADSGKIGDFYRKVVGHKLSFGRTLLQQQSSRWVRPLSTRLDRLEGKGGKDASQLLSGTERQARNAESTLLREFNASKKAAENGLEPATASKLSRREQEIETVQHARTLQAEEAVNNAERVFRSEAVEASLPSSVQGTTKELFVKADESLNTVMGRLREVWTDTGFEFIKNRKFRISPEKFTEDIKLDIGAELAEFNALYGNSPINMVGLIEDVFFSSVNKGWIDGEDLSQLRSRIGSQVSATGDGGQAEQTKFVLRSILNKLNDTVFDQLSAGDKVRFTNERAAWAVMSNLSDSVVTASSKAGRRGSFTADEWLSNLRGNNRRGFEKGTAAFQKEANRMGDLMKRRDAIISKLADQAKQRKINVTNLQQGAVRNQANKLARESVGGSIDDQAERLRLGQQYQNTHDALESIKTLMPDDKGISSVWQALMIGGGLYFDVATAATLGVSSRVLANPALQRIVAGQSSGQSFVANALGKGSKEAAERARSAVVQGNVAADTRQLTLQEKLEIGRVGTEEEKESMFRKLQAQGDLAGLRTLNPELFRELSGQ